MSKVGNAEIWFTADLSEGVFDDERTAESLRVTFAKKNLFFS
jgi:hypothetical protein